MCGHSEEVPNLKSQLLNKEIIFLYWNKRISSPSLDLMVVLEGAPVEEKAGSEGQGFPLVSPHLYDTWHAVAPSPHKDTVSSRLKPNPLLKPWKLSLFFPAL